MKALPKTLLLLAFLSSSFFVSASSISKVGGPKLYNQLRSYLSDFPQEQVDGELTFKLRFMINEKSEIIVLSTSNEDFDEYIKSALNYKKIENHDLKANQLYIMPLTLKEL